MSKYYCLIAGLPNIALDDSKLTYSVADFRTELAGILSAKDKKLVDLFYRKYDNLNLLAYLKNPNSQPDERGSISYEEIGELYRALKNEEKLPSGKNIPVYFKTFLAAYLAEEAGEQKETVSKVAWEDRLAALYYAYAMKCGNRFVADWFELNLNINNVLTAITCRKYNLDKNDYIVGDNEVAESIRTSNARDFGLTDSIETVLSLSDGLLVVDVIGGEEMHFSQSFSLLDKTTGEQTFRQIVGAMKKGSINALEEFKKSSNK